MNKALAMNKTMAFLACALGALCMATTAEARPKKRKPAAQRPAATAPSASNLNAAQLQGGKSQSTTGATVQAQKVPLPEATILIRSSLTALQQANDTKDYSVLFGLGSKTFQAANSPEALAKTFAPLQPYNISSVLVYEPSFTQAPVLTSQGVITTAGYFLVDGFKISFDLAYVMEGDHWKLETLSAGLKQVEPTPAH